MSPLPEFRLDHQESVPVARLTGELDLSQAGELRGQLLAAVDNQDHGLVIDLTETRYIDSAVVNVMFELAERLAARRLRFAVVLPERGLVERVLTIVDLGSVAELHRSVDAAVAALQPG